MNSKRWCMPSVTVWSDSLRKFLKCDAESSYLALEPDDDDSMAQLQGHSITYRIAAGSHQGRKVFA